jgi:hypothetical protein
MNKKRLFIFKQALALFMVLCSVWGWGQSLIAGWTFPSTNGAAPLVIAAECGNGSIYANGTNGSSTWTSAAANDGYQFFGGVAITPAICTVTSATGALTPTGNGNNGKSIVFKISTVSFKDLNLSYSTRGTSTGYTTHTWSYSTDGSEFTNISTITGRTNTTFSTQTVDFSGVSALNNKTEVLIRLTFTGASNNSGNNRIDNIKFVGTALPTCTTAGFSFADGNTISKTTNDAPFTNLFTSNDNTSPKVFSSSNTHVAPVNSATGEVTIVGVGSTTISVTQAADATYCAVSASYVLNVTSAAPVLSISGDANHGSSCINTAASVQSYTITNSGSSAAEGLSVTSDNPQFVVSNISSTTVNGVNGTVTFDVTFTPAAAGAQNASLMVTSTTSGSNPATYQITGTGNPTVAPAVAVGNADVTNDAATLHGNVTSLGSCLASPIVNRGFVYTVFSSPEINGGTYVNEGTAATGAFSVNISGLVPAKTYYYKAFVVDAAGHYYYSPTEGTFTTSLATPVATAATNVTPVGFTANWNAVNGGESYVLEVYEETGAPMADLIISEYVEGSGNNKVIEIFNGTGATVNLANYSLRKQSNGVDPYASDLPLAGTLQNGATYVVANSSANTTLLALAQQTSSTATMTFNGNDAVALFKNGVQLDEVGVFNQTTDWGANVSLRRKSSVGAPKATYVVGEWDSFAIDTFNGLGSHTANTVTQTLISTQNVGNVLSFSITGLNPDSNYTYTVKAVSGSVTSAASNIIEVTTQGTPTWNGTAWSNTNGPDATTPAIIDGDYEGAAITAQSLTVNAGKTLTVNNYVSVGNVTNNGNILVADGANFVQTGTFTAGAGSSFKVRKDTKPVKRLAYINWSSPMAGSTQTLKDFSYGKKADGSNQSATGTVDNRFFTYNNNTFVSISPTTTFEAGAGYQIRTPNDFTTTPQVFHGQFEGTTPNTGAISVHHNGIITGDYVLLGNPYPSAISISDFLTHNPGTQETFYIWNSGAEMIDNAYGGGNYNTYAPNTGSVPAGSINGYIPVGQGFFIKRGAAIAPFVFTNAMRQTMEDGVFSKAATADKFWLELTAPSGSKPQMLIGFNAAATAGYDAGFDAALFGTNADALYSEVNGTKLVIDAHGTFSSDDTFALKADLSAAGNYTIGILKSEGVFAIGQQIWLKDQLTGTTTLISEQPYAFSADAGTLANRFTLQFKPGGALATDSAVKSDINIYSAGSDVHAKSSENITSLHVYDMSGRMIAKAPAAQKEIVLNVAYKGVVLVKAQLANGTVKTTKLMLK